MDAPGATKASTSREDPGHSLPAGSSTQHSQLHADTEDTFQDDEAQGREDEDSATEKGSGTEGEEDEEEDEPHLKYSYLTKHLGAVYRNGDATSTFSAVGDKMVCFFYCSRASRLTVTFSRYSEHIMVTL